MTHALKALAAGCLLAVLMLGIGIAYVMSLPILMLAEMLERRA